MAINWTIMVPGPEGIPVPTYGNYGGPLYSDGHVLASENERVDYSSPPVDTLDGLFLLHDQAYDVADPNVRAEADLALARSVAALPDETTSAHEDLYGGGAVLFGLLQMAEVNGRPDLATGEEAASLAVRALEMIGSGIAEASPEDRAAFEAYAATAAPYAEDAAVDGLSSAWSAAENAFGTALDVTAAALPDIPSVDPAIPGHWDFL